jgi:CubicO group peptidase (beta-lactamase class C family)
MKTAKATRFLRSITATLPLLFLLTCTHQTVRIPTTPAGRAMSEFLAAYNSADFQRVAAFLELHGSRDRAVERAHWVMGFLYPGVRRFIPEEVINSTPEAITLRGRSDLTEAWYRFIIEFESLPPHGVAFGFENDEAPPAWEGRTDNVASYLRRVVDEDFFSGTVMIADDDRVLHSGAYGDVKATATQINLGSANKMFTAVAIMQLVEQGTVRLAATVGRYIPDYPNREAREQVTVHHLLTHTSGVGDFFNEQYMRRKKELRSVAELLPLFAAEPLAFRPGERWQYSNGGYAALGRVIEIVSGLSYEDYVQRHVYAPAGMTRTSGDPHEPYARGHTFMRQGGAIALSRDVNDFALAATGSPAGGGYSTVEDLVSFARALRGGRLVSAESLDLMLTPYVATDRGAEYGYGFEITRRDGETVFGHNGHHLGISAQLDVYRESGKIVAVLSNYDPPAAPVTAARLGRLSSF